jgi:hypothetical protein
MMTFTYRIGPDVQIQFNEKPPANVRACLKAHGFSWSPRAGLWWRRKVTGAAEVLEGLRRLIEPRKPVAPCWTCKNSDGYFRNEGAATPVRCDQCQAVAVYWHSLRSADHEEWRRKSQGTELSAAQLAYANRPQPSQPSQPTAEDYPCTDAGYEDACARACGF